MVFKIAVVGLGKIATDQHLPCIAKNRNFKLVAGVSRHAKLDKVPCFESLGDQFQAARSQLMRGAVHAAVSAPCHGTARRLIRASIVLIEKPPTPTVGEMFAMIAYAESQEPRALCRLAFALQPGRG